MIVNVLVRRLFRWLCLDGNCLAIHDTVFFMNSGAIHPSVEMNDACSPNMCGRSGLRRICLPGPSECRGKARQPGSRSGGRRPSFAQPPPSGHVLARLVERNGSRGGFGIHSESVKVILRQCVTAFDVGRRFSSAFFIGGWHHLRVAPLACVLIGHPDDCYGILAGQLTTDGWQPYDEETW